jgi:hypothetical protein
LRKQGLGHEAGGKSGKNVPWNLFDGTMVMREIMLENHSAPICHE